MEQQQLVETSEASQEVEHSGSQSEALAQPTKPHDEVKSENVKFFQSQVTPAQTAEQVVLSPSEQEALSAQTPSCGDSVNEQKQSVPPSEATEEIKPLGSQLIR